MTVITVCYNIFRCIYTYKLEMLGQNILQQKKVFALGDPVCVCFFSPSVKSVASPSLSLSVSLALSLLTHAAGVLAWFLAAVKTAPGKILSCKDQEALCAPVCVYPCQDCTQT